MIKSEFISDATLSNSKEQWQFAEDILQKVSRTFALNIQVLPTRLRKPVLLAYLLCRIADTIEDDPDLSADAKEYSLRLFSQIFTDAQNSTEHLNLFIESIPETWTYSEIPDQFLCLKLPWIMPLYNNFSQNIKDPIIQCIKEMTVGMAQFARRQEDSAHDWLSISSEADLDNYCYHVAGVVGNMLCDLFFIQSPLIGRKRYEKMRKLAVSFGLGLQVTNIVKDIKEDSLRQVCFIPLDWIQEAGFSSPADLFKNENSEKQAQLALRLAEKAQKHLSDAVKFTILIPSLEHRIRLFCLWPLFMATETLVALGDGKAVFAEKKVKITRTQVKNIIRTTGLRAWCNRWVQRSFKNYEQQINSFKK